ncbi:uncharacterized protein EDB93DRAFT_1076570 [Suillus bovinus]|uniref:uncharacterized protein n=1 Tax=Suillus bovinus TaxID=48563 RepID=UPI001B8632FA|nr:uncharacterized protein EDB93DRAFT_1076570 [Suillus bovinus]KAG2158563.1 hypothetical protein EDB93DRAFT_1076570 [Suillus bovinus]
MDKPAQVARFSLSSLAALHSSSFTQGFSNGEQQAAAHMLLKHEAHVDGTHYHTRKPGGLHPSHIAFNSYMSSNKQSITQEDFLNAALQDLFDAITMQDCLDGGISILMRCAGSEASEMLSPEHFTVDLYITPWEYRETPEWIWGDLSALHTKFHYSTGAAKNHQKHCSDVRAVIHHKIQKGLVAITKDENMKMHWANYFRNNIQHYQVVIEGWPANIPFVNLSQALSAVTSTFNKPLFFPKSS